MKRYITLLLSILLTFTLMAQKPKNVEFTREGLPDELLEYMNKSTSDSDRQKEITKTLKEFKSVYPDFDGQLQERLVAIYSYAVKAKMKGNPEMCSLTRVLTGIATTPSAGTDVANAYGNAENLEGFVSSLELFVNRKAKAKAIIEFVDFCEGLFKERVLFRSNSCEWRFEPRTPFRLDAKGELPLVYFETASDLHYASAKDEGVIKGTTGIYNYKENEWRGNGGRLEWTRTGLAANECYADLSSYSAETKFPKFKADSVLFVHTRYFDKPIRGRIEEVLNTPSEPAKYSYPRFRSYQRDFIIPDIMPNVDYSGSFMMNGSKFITASSKHPASLIFNQGGKGRLAVSSTKFTITPDRMLAENAAVVLRLGEDDSITNTGILVRYVPADKQVVLVNDSKRNYYSPYIDTYHQLDIYSENIVWRLESGDLLFSNLASGGAEGSASFESSNYYTYTKYRDVKGIDEVSPVQRVFEFSRSMGSEFSVKAFSDEIGMDMSQTLLMIHTLSRHGLVSYNEMTGTVRVKEKLIDYQNAYMKKKDFDYDALSLESSAAGSNARLTLDDDKLLIRGVSRFVVSDSQAVIVYPDSLSGALVTVGRNRDLHFSGRIAVGKFTLSVKDCDFSYENYRFTMPQIERMEFYVPDFKQPDQYEQLVRTPLSNLVGTLDVDRPDNHCGLKKNKEYPIFNSLENSNVFYDAKDIQGGQYVRDRFYYTLLPFTINSMIDIAVDSLQFNGILTSGGIFPDIKEPLRVQHDYYLGFNISTPDGGLPAYGGKGQYTKKLKLDHSGLHGAGELSYLTAKSKSKNFLFLLDSTVAVTDTFTVREEQGFPQIANGKTDLHWLPYQDSMAVASLENGNPFKMYRGDASLRGRVALMPKGASASGSAQVHEGIFVSQHFALTSREMSSEVSDFTLRSSKFNTVAFSASNMRSHVNYDTRRADLEARNENGEMMPVNLQLAGYQAFADRFSWEMDRKELTLANSTRGTSEGLDAMDIRLRLPKANDLPGVRFVKNDKTGKADTLSQSRNNALTYHALLSTYKYDLGELSSQGVYLLNIADAVIAPAADTLHVCKGGEMKVLNKAQMLFNRDSAYHYIFNADLLVTGANSLTGKGYYDYRNDQEKPQKLFLDNISVNAEGVTVAQGKVSDSAAFALSSAFGFAGKVRVEGNQRWPFFEGGVRLIQPCLSDDKLGLLAYADYTDPMHVHIAVPEEPTDWKGKRITASILLDRSTLQPHAAFLTNDKVDNNELLSAHGILTYLGDQQEYMVASEEKVSSPDDIVSPYLTLSAAGCNVQGEGPVNFAIRNTPAEIYAYGSASYGINSDKDDQLTTVFGFNFPIAKELITSMADNIKDDLHLQPAGATTSAEMRHALMYHLGADEGAAAYASYSLDGELESVPEAMRSNALFDNIHWRYTISMGHFFDGKANLVAIGDKPLGLKVNLKAQIFIRNRKQMMFFHIQASKDHWYAFLYNVADQELALYSSNGLWLDQVKALSPEQRRVKKEGAGTMRYYAGDTAEVDKLLRWFSQSAYSEEEE